MSVATKRPQGQNIQRHNVCLGYIFNVHARQYNIFTENLLKGLGHEIIIRVRPRLGESPADIHFFFSAINFILN